MEASNDFDTATVKLEMEEEPEEEKPPILAPPSTIPVRRGAPPAKQRRMLFPTPSEPFSTEYSHHFSCVDRFNEELSMRFLIGNGMPLTKIADPHLKLFLYHLNPGRAAPEVSHLITKANCEMRPSIDYTHIGPMSVTIEAIRKSDEVFLSISVHYYGNDGERRNHVHFEKIILADYEGRVVADRLRRVIDPRKNYNMHITNIVSPNIRMVQLLSEHIKFKNKFICFYSYLCNIAREVILIEEFASALRVLRKFVDSMRKYPEVLIKFRRMQQSSAEPDVDLPCLDLATDWLTTLQFLMTCGLLNDVFLNLNEGWCLPPYLNAEQENALANLADFLTVLCHVSTEICSTDSCVSQVLYSMSIVNNAIENCGIRSARTRMRAVFTKYFQSISTGRIGDFYSIAAYLDPRYGYSTMIFAEDDWQTVETKLVKETSQHAGEHSFAKQQQVLKEVEKYKSLMTTHRPEFDEVNTPTRWWSTEQFPILYKKWIEFSCPPAVSIDGKRLFGKGGKLAHLFATLDEVLHHKATLLAQNSQDFIGRGNGSQLLFDQIKFVATSFRRLENEPDLEDGEEIEQKPVLESEVIKQEIQEEYGDEDLNQPPKLLREVKLEEPETN